MRLLYENEVDIELKNKDNVLVSEYANLLVNPLNIIFKNCKDLDREKMNLKIIISSYKKN